MAVSTTTVKKAPQRKELSLRWKWALGSAVGVFLIFILFAWFVVAAFSNQMVNNEKRSMVRSTDVVEQRFADLHTSEMSVAQIEDLLRPRGNDYSEISSDPVVSDISRQGYEIYLFDNHGRQIFPSQPSDFKFESVSHMNFRQINSLFSNRGHIIGTRPIFNRQNQRLGYVVIENRLQPFHQVFDRVYLIIAVLIAIGILLIGMFGYWWSDYLLQPVARIQDVVDKINLDPQAPNRVELRSQYEDELTALAKLLNDMLDRMQRFILQQHQFVEDVSHELRTPVAIVKGHMELLNRWGKDDPKILEESISASLTEMKRMEVLVQEMLDLTRADQVELTFKDGDTDVQEVMHAVYNNFSMIKPEFSFSLEDDLKGPTIVNMSRDHLEQILIILSDNAVKYSQERKEVHFAVSSAGPNVMIAVQDFGEGISPEDAARVFDRFYRVDKARSRKQGGNGLGLSIAQKLIEGYGGHIELESAIGHGSLFRITLPIKTKQ